MDKIPVTLRALVQRINRHLAHREEVLKKARGDGAALREFGEYYILDTRRNGVETTNVDPVALARELGLLHGWEVAEGEGEPERPAAVEEPEAVPVPEAAAGDPHKHRLGSLCQRQHAFQGTGQSLRHLISGACVECARMQQPRRQRP